jgi:hypothetical protein
VIDVEVGSFIQRAAWAVVIIRRQLLANHTHWQ